MSSAHRGQFVWHELMTTDTAGAGEFYPRIAGWKTQPWDDDSSYTLWVGNDGPLGGVMSLPQEAPASSHWMPYIGTDDVVSTVAAARDLGASVVKDITQLPNGGSYAVLQDPHGATFAVHSSGGAQPAQAQVQSDFSWHELSTADLDAALQFYSELFGWEAAEKHDMGEMGYYQLFARSGRNIGGMFVTPPGVSPSWLSYVRVSDVDEAADAAKAGGGRVINGPMEVPGGDWIAHIIDPQGAAFAVHEVKSAVQPAKAAQPRKAKTGSKPKQPKTQKAAAPAARAKPKRTRAAAKAKKAPAKRAAAKSPKAKSRLGARRSPARAKTTSKAKASRKRASARAAAVARSKRSVRTARAPAKKASARRRPAVRKKASGRSAGRVVRTKRRH